MVNINTYYEIPRGRKNSYEPDSFCNGFILNETIYLGGVQSFVDGNVVRSGVDNGNYGNFAFHPML